MFLEACFLRLKLTIFLNNFSVNWIPNNGSIRVVLNFRLREKQKKKENENLE